MAFGGFLGSIFLKIFGNFWVVNMNCLREWCTILVCKLPSYQVTKNKQVTKLPSYQKNKENKKMEITVGNERKFTIKIDKEDYEKIKDKTIYCKINGDRREEIFVKYSKYDNKKYLKRIITDAKKEEVILHINGDLLDFRKENLFKTNKKDLVQLQKEKKIIRTYDDQIRPAWRFAPKFKLELMGK